MSTQHPKTPGGVVSMARPAPLAAAPGESLKPRLLIVDDIADNRIILARRFQRRNFDVVEADCGAKALEIINSESFDVVLLDVIMPDMSGLEVLRKIRATRSGASLPVIMVTANNSSADIVGALELAQMTMSPNPSTSRSRWRGSTCKSTASARLKRWRRPTTP